MVGFLNHEDNEEESSNIPSNKLKNTVDPSWSDSFDFLDQFVPEIDDISIPGNTSFLDLDSIKDWLEEMQDPIVKLESGGVVETLSEPAPYSGGDVLLEGSGVDNACSIETEQVDGIDGSGEGLREESEGLEDSAVEKGGGGEKLTSLDSFVEDLAVEKEGGGEKSASLDSVVEEGFGKVSLVDEVELNLVDSAVVKEDDDESSGSESESEISDSSAASSASSSSSSGEDADDVVDERENKGVSKEGVCEVEEELEEGEIMETDADKVVHSNSEDEDDDDKDIFNGEFLMDDEDDEDGPIGGVKVPIMSKNELKELPPVPPVDVTLQPSHQMLPVGVVSSVLGAKVIVEGGEKHNPLSEGSILWITERRSALGRVDEIFGPVKNPYYIVRYNSESEVPEGIHEGISVSFVPEFVDHVLNNQNLYQKGYDASGDNDEENLDEAEFSDDEKEAEYRRMMKMSKRGNNNTDTKPGGNKRSGKNFRRNEMHSSNYHQSNSMQARDSPVRHPTDQQGESPVRHPTDHSNQPGSSRFSPAFPAGPGLMPGHPQQGPPPNGMPFQMQNGGFQMPWIQQQHPQQLPMMNSGPPFQQAFNPAGQTPNNMGMLPNAFNQVPFSMALQAQLAQLSMLSGLLAGQGGAVGNNMQQHLPPGLQQNGEAPPPQFNQGPRPSHHQGGAGSNNMQQQHLPPSFQQSGEAPPPPQFNQGPGSSHHGGRPPFQRRGGRSGGGRGRGGRRGGGHPFQSR